MEGERKEGKEGEGEGAVEVEAAVSPGRRSNSCGNRW